MRKRLYTGKRDKNGKQMFEGDIVSVNFEGDPTPSMLLIKKDNDGWSGLDLELVREFDVTISIRFQAIMDLEPEIIDNKYDSPELLEKGEDD